MNQFDSDAFAQALFGMAGAFAQITELSTGHRASLEAAGYSPTMAEQIAGALHIAMIQSLLRPQSKS